jgi:secondary thiamine-phosphate synthase enzyme
MVFRKHLRLETRGHGDVQDLSEAVLRVVENSGIRTGLAHVFHSGSTAAIGAIEFEPGLAQDLPEMLDRLVPPSQEYAHEKAWHDGNGHSHLQATILGPSLMLPVEGGAPVLGTWQQVVLVECDVRPRERTIIVTVMGE